MVPSARSAYMSEIGSVDSAHLQNAFFKYLLLDTVIPSFSLSLSICPLPLSLSLSRPKRSTSFCFIFFLSLRVMWIIKTASF